ncbi:MAG: glycosyltransferase family 2 protein [Hyphomicrobiaceae bacterium]
MRLSIVCPFFNEEAIIAKAVARMLANLSLQFAAGDWELILVDDGSRDRSRATLIEALAAAGAMAQNVRVMSYDYNQGRGRALKTGIDAARGDIIVTTEVDCSWGDDIVLRLVNELDANPSCHFVVASVHMPGGGLANVPARRRFLTKVGNILIRFFFASEVTMNTGMTRAYRRHVIQPLVTLENGKEFHLEVLLKLLSLGFRVREIPATITWMDAKLADHNKKARKSSTNIQKTINSHLRFIAIAQPVQYFAKLSVASFVVGALMLGWAVLQLLLRGPSVFFAIIGLVMLMFCLLFLGFSVLFHQVREQMTAEWRREYPKPLPPHVLAGKQIYPASSGANDVSAPAAGSVAPASAAGSAAPPEKPACAA